MAVLSVLGGLDGGGDAGDGGSGGGGSGSGNGGGSGIVGGGSGGDVIGVDRNGDVIGVDRNGDGDVDGDGGSGGGGESQAERGGGQAGVRRKRRHDQLDDDNLMSDWDLLDEGVEAGGVPASHADGRSPGGVMFFFLVQQQLTCTFVLGALLRRARAR